MKPYNKYTYISLALVLAFLMPLSGCGKQSEDNRVVASIGKINITVADFIERVKNLPLKYQEFVKKRKQEFLEELVNDNLLYQEAIRKGLNNDREVQRVIEEAKKKILIAKLLKDQVDDSIKITDEDVKQYYDEHHEKYMTPEIMRVSHILVPTKEEAEKILAEINQGSGFEDVARAKSVDPTAQRGGDVGYFPKGQLMPEFEAGCDNLKVGDISGVVKTKLGYHIIKLTDRRKPELRPIEQVKENIKAELRTVKRQSIFNELIEKLRKETPVKIDEKALSEAIESSVNTDKKGAK
jgi:peptidyl-prolyl cis-trans isomerase C